MDFRAPRFSAAVRGVPVRLLAVACLAASAWSCAAHRPVSATPEVPGRPAPVEKPSSHQPATRGGVEHVVQPGQTLWRIARVYGVRLAELERVNGIENPTQIEVGRSLFIPGATAPLEVPAYPAPPPPVGRAAPPSKQPSWDGGFAWPVAGGQILSYFGALRGDHRHSGLDIRGVSGQKVRAVAAGRVVYSGGTMRGYGKTVILDHGQGLRSLYAHNSTLLVRRGEWVERRQPIARIGRTGNATTEHCHFEIRRNGVPIDPLPYVSGDRP